MTKPDYVFQRAQRAHEEPADDPPGPLDDKPLGYCPWCGWTLVPHEGVNICSNPFLPVQCNYSADLNEAENRARYAREIEADAKLEERIARESRKLGRGGDW